MTSPDHDHDSPAAGPYCPGCRQPVRDHLGLNIDKAANQPPGLPTILLDVLYCTRCQYTITVTQHPAQPLLTQTSYNYSVAPPAGAPATLGGQCTIGASSASLTSGPGQLRYGLSSSPVSPPASPPASPDQQ